MSAPSAIQILEKAHLSRIATKLCDEEHLKTMADLAALSDARIDGLLWMKKPQREKLKELCAACRQGDPDLATAIGIAKYTANAPGKILRIDTDVADMDAKLPAGSEDESSSEDDDHDHTHTFPPNIQDTNPKRSILQLLKELESLIQSNVP
jgi:hypothetical protein